MNKSIIIQKAAISPVNSTSYADVLGLQTGLERFPEETSDQFLRRVQSAVQLNQSPNYEGLLNQLNLQFGLEAAEMFRLTNTNGTFHFSVSIAGIVITSRTESLAIPTRTVDPDGFWKWRRIADIVRDINASQTYSADLLKDGPAVQLVWQNNARQVRNEPVSGTIYVLRDQLVDETSVLFNVAVPDWVFSENARSILFDRAVPDGTRVSYQHLICPYAAIGYPAAALSLTDPLLKQAAVAADGKLIYQVREYLYRVAEQDRSYWGN